MQEALNIYSTHGSKNTAYIYDDFRRSDTSIKSLWHHPCLCGVVRQGCVALLLYVVNAIEQLTDE